MTKKEIIQRLTDACIEFDSKALKADLEKLLPIEGNVSLGNPNPSAKLEIKGCDKYKASYKSKGRIHFLGIYATEKEAEQALGRAGAHIPIIEHIKSH